MTAGVTGRDGDPRALGSRRRNTMVALGCGVAVALVMGVAVTLEAGPSTPVDEAVGTAPLPSRAATAPAVAPAPSAPVTVEPPAASTPAPSAPRPASPSPPAAAPPVAPEAPEPPVPPQASASGPATPAPPWLGTRPLAPAGSGPVPPQVTPPELADRRLLTVDLLPPPTTEEFLPQVSAVPPEVLDRSTWQPSCPVAADDLRYLLVPHWGFDERPHTGELIVHADAVDAVLAIFAAMHEDRFPVEEVRVIRADELEAAPTGDGNVTSAFVCREAVGGGGWSRHAYGRAVDINPFHNPYDKGTGDRRLVLPELATVYTDRDRVLPGMLRETSGAVRAADAAGWGWGGRWQSSRDWMHFSDNGR